MQLLNLLPKHNNYMNGKLSCNNWVRGYSSKHVRCYVLQVWCIASSIELSHTHSNWHNQSWL